MSAIRSERTFNDNKKVEIDDVSQDKESALRYFSPYFLLTI